uniref:Uncharacterized protein n=1 Tax=Populus alba TaxID=43335 RepID=A0A4U5QA68_POPAL|nr:hypothetical protein D5086_0000115800 [Populus alba]
MCLKAVILALYSFENVLSSCNEDENVELKGVFRGDVTVAGETSSNDHSKDSEFSLFRCSDLIIAFSGDENMEMDRLLAAPGRETTDVAETSSNDQREYSNSNTELFLFADKSYEQFMEKLDSSTNYSSRLSMSGVN